MKVRGAGMARASQCQALPWLRPLRCGLVALVRLYPLCAGVASAAFQFPWVCSYGSSCLPLSLVRCRRVLQFVLPRIQFVTVVCSCSLVLIVGACLPLGGCKAFADASSCCLSASSGGGGGGGVLATLVKWCDRLQPGFSVFVLIPLCTLWQRLALAMRLV